MDYTIEYQDLSFKAYSQLKELIIRGELKPGEKIAQEAIAQKLGISRMPLHKAFQMLENEMLVESIPRRGIFVRENDLQIIADAFECREAIESVASRRLALEASKEDLDQLQRLFEPFLDNLRNADAAKYQEADHKFHTLIIKLTGNTILMKMEIHGQCADQQLPPWIDSPTRRNITRAFCHHRCHAQP
jgi:GntR family transcriptional regulator, vanillate catabolism transcriptional regulator